MWVNLLAVPSPTWRITVRAARAVLAATGHACDEIAEPTLAGLGRAIKARRHPHVLYRPEAPEADVLRTLLDSGTPVAVALADPSDVVRHGLPGRRFTDALSAAALSYAAIAEALASPSAIHLPHACSATVGELVDGLAAAFHVRWPAEARADAARRLGASPAMTLAEAVRNLTPASTGPAAPPLTEAQRLIAAAALGPLAADAPPDRLVWPGALFLDEAGTPLDGPVPLLGPRRLIGRATGHLPRGTWHASLAGSTDGNISGNGLSVLMASGSATVTSNMRLPLRGLVHIETMLVVDNPLSRIVARISTTEGAIEGSLGVDAVTWQRTT